MRRSNSPHTLKIPSINPFDPSNRRVPWYRIHQNRRTSGILTSEHRIDSRRLATRAIIQLVMHAAHGKQRTHVLRQFAPHLRVRRKVLEQSKLEQHAEVDLALGDDKELIRARVYVWEKYAAWTERSHGHGDAAIDQEGERLEVRAACGAPSPPGTALLFCENSQIVALVRWSFSRSLLPDESVSNLRYRLICVGVVKSWAIRSVLSLGLLPIGVGKALVVANCKAMAAIPIFEVVVSMFRILKR